jgi:hypothetical protein
VLKVTSWHWPQWVIFSLGLLYLASYFGLIGLGRVEQELEWLAGSPEATSSIYQGSGQAEALFMVFAFLFLTPVAAVIALFVPLFLSAVVAAFLERTVRLPVVVGTVLFWLVLLTVAGVYSDHWWPHAQWFVNLLARGFLIALQNA